MAFNVFHNPAKEFLQFEKLTASFQFAIFNTAGVKLKEGMINLKQNAIDIKAFAKGIYYLEMKDEQGRNEVLKWVKE